MQFVTQIKIPQEINRDVLSKNLGTIANQPSQPKDGFRIFINSQAEFQTLQGVGGSFSELGGKALASLSLEQQQEVASKLFSEDFSIYRLPIGSSDFALKEYSLNDNEGDFEMEQFALDHDQEYIIPYMNMAKAVNPELILHISPWSPPGWLKENNSMLNGGSLKRKESYYRAYAKYLTKYIVEYQKLGFDIVRLNVQNEPDVSTIYPSCIFEDEDMSCFISEYLADEFRKESIKTEIFAGTFRSFNGASGLNFLTNNPQILPFIGGVSFQYSVMTQIQDIRSLYPNLKIMHTESNCHNGDNSWVEAMFLYTDIIDYINSSCDTFTYWNMILNKSKLSSWGWTQNSLITIDEEEKKVVYNPDFEVMKLAAKCLKKGSRRVSFTSLTQNGLATKGVNGKIRVMTNNFSTEDVYGKIIIDKQEHDCQIPAQTICLFEFIP